MPGLAARPRSPREYKETLDWVFELLPRLKERRAQPTGTLSGGELQMVEQNVQMALAVSDYAYVLSGGRIEIDGEAHAVRQMKNVRKAYLGV